MTKILLVTTGGADAVAARLLAKPGIARGEVFRELFPDNEVYHRLVTPVANSEVVVVGNFESPEATLELYDVANLLADEGALGLTLVVPESTSKNKQARFLKRVQNRMLAGIPQTPLGNRLVEVDPSCPSMPFYSKVTAPKAKSKVGGMAAVELFGSRGRPVLFSTKSYGYMQEQFHALADFGHGEVLRDDAGVVKGLSQSVEGRDVVVISGTIDDTETMDLFVLANAIYEGGALSITMVIPYFGYQTMERGKPELHEAVKAAFRARLLSSIPRCPMGNRVVMCDLHSEGIPHYFGNGVRTTHLYCIKQVIMDMVGDKVGGRICTTDAGRGKWAESLVKDINRRLAGKGASSSDLWQAAFALKDRKSGSETELLGVLGDVAGLDIDLFDDMIRRGSTAIDAAKGYRFGIVGNPGTGCKKIRFVASHGVLPGPALERLQKAVDHEGQLLFSEVIVTDSHPRAVALAGDFLKVKQIANLLVAQVVQSLAIGN